MPVTISDPVTIDVADDFQVGVSPREKRIRVNWHEGYVDSGTDKFVRVRGNGYAFVDGEEEDGTPITEYTDMVSVATQDGETLGAALQRVVRAALQIKGLL